MNTKNIFRIRKTEVLVVGYQRRKKRTGCGQDVPETGICAVHISKGSWFLKVAKTDEGRIRILPLYDTSFDYHDVSKEDFKGFFRKAFSKKTGRYVW